MITFLIIDIPLKEYELILFNVFFYAGPFEPANFLSTILKKHDRPTVNVPDLLWHLEFLLINLYSPVASALFTYAENAAEQL